MRRYICIVLVLIVAFAAFTAYGAAGVFDKKDQLEFELQTFYGDESALDGLNIYDLTSASGYTAEEGYAMWQSDISFSGGQPIYSTEYSEGYTQRQLEDRFWPDIQGYGIMARFDSRVGSELNVNNTLLTQFDKADVLEKGAGYSTYILRLSDAFEYYPADIEIRLPDGFNVSEDTVSNFLKIPVLEEESVMFSKSSYGINWMQQYSAFASDTFRLDLFGGVAEDSYYFSFCNKTRQGNTVDCSSLPLPYGIYKMDKNGEISLYMQLDVSVNLLHLGVDLSGTRMYLHFYDGEMYSVRVLDITSSKLIGEYTVDSYNPYHATLGNQANYFPKVFEGRGSEVIAFCFYEESYGYKWNSDRVYLLTDSGVSQYTDRLDRYEFEGFSEFPVSALYGYGPFAAASKGNRLAIVKKPWTVQFSDKTGARIIYDNRDTSAEIWVFGPEGLEYMGLCRCSLDKTVKQRDIPEGNVGASEEENYYNRNIFDYNINFKDCMYVLW